MFDQTYRTGCRRDLHILVHHRRVVKVIGIGTRSTPYVCGQPSRLHLSNELSRDMGEV